MAFSPAISPLKVENIYLVQVSFILMIWSFKNKCICSYTSEFFHYCCRLYMLASLIWFLDCNLSSLYIFTLRISVTTNYYQWFYLKHFSGWHNASLYLLYLNYQLLLLSVNWIKHSGHYQSPYRILLKHFSSHIHFHPKEIYFGVVYKRMRPYDFQNYVIKFSLLLGKCYFCSQ